MPHATSALTLLTDPAEARERFAALVEREPEALSVVASVTQSLIADPGRYADPCWWAGIAPSGEVVAAFMHTPPHPLHVALATSDEARDLAALLAEAGDDLPGVGGERAAAEAFADEWTARTGARATVAMRQGRYDLPVRPRLPFEVPGRFRVATAADTLLVDGWHQQFYDAIEGAGRHAPPLTRQLADGRVGLWEAAGEPVSMAYASPASGGVTRVSGVWTPPEQRGHGYASGVVAALSAARMDAGERCMLYTDLANATSNAIYSAIGYRRVAYSVSITFGR